MTDKLLTDNALAAKAITLEQAQSLENWIDDNLDEYDEDTLEIPAHLQEIFDIAMHHLFDGRKLH